MRVVALVSGGKDSCYNLMQCIAAGHQIVALANVVPESRDELDSFMYQTVGHQGVSLYAEAMGLPLFRQQTSGIAHNHHKCYVPTKGDEVEDLYNLLSKIKEEIPIEGVACGAILSDYQRLRVENVCSRLGLTSLAYLWRRDQGELLNEMIDCHVDAMVIKVAALGLDPSVHLGMRLPEIRPHLAKMNEKYGLNMCGEGGEYETFTLDCPFFKKRIVVDEFETVLHSDDAVAPVGYINFKKLSLADKSEHVSNVYVKGPLEYLSDLELPDDQLGTTDSDDDNETLPKEKCSSSLPDIVQEGCDVSNFAPSSTNVCSNMSGWCWLSSIVGNDPDPCIAVKIALAVLTELLRERHYGVEDLVAVTLFVRDMAEFGKMNAAYAQTVVNANNPPVRVCVQTSLPPGCPVLLDALAYKNISDSPSCSVQRKTLHVQSISHWAPANIGPYSQAIKVGEIIYVAGQIALLPGTMTLVDGGIREQCRLALRHVGRIINAIDQNTLLRDVVQGICYVTNKDYIRPARKEWEKRTNNAIVDYVVVPKLPRDAKIEWHVWAHRGNARFQYEETGCRIDKCRKVFLRRRFNYENTVCAVVCYLATDNGGSLEGDLSAMADNGLETLQECHVKEVIGYALRKLAGGEPEAADHSCHMRVFYRNDGRSGIIVDLVLRELKALSSSAAYTLIPVSGLYNPSTILSLCAIRHTNNG